MRRVLLATCVAGSMLLAGCRDVTEPTPPGNPSLARAPGAGQSGQYIVVFNDDVGNVPGLAQALAKAHGGRLQFTYQRALKGFAGELP